MENITGKEKTNTVEIKVADINQTAKAIQLLKTLDYISYIEQKETRGFVVTLQKYNKSSDLLTVLISNGIKIEAIKPVTQSLEEIYLEIMHREKANA
jgi:hypothetical protein